MKFHVDAIDSEGHRRVEVARADSEEELRELMLAEGIFPKRVEPASEEEKVTFAPRRGIEERLAARRGTRPEPTLPSGGGDTTILWRGDARVSGRIGLVGESLVFQADNPDEGLHLALERVEAARIRGFPARVLEVVTLDGETLAFAAGFLFAGHVFKEIATRAG